MVCAIGDELGNITNRIAIPTTTPKETMPQIISYFREQQVEAVGIGCFGPIDLNRDSDTYGYITSTPKLAWAHYNIVGNMEKELGCPVGFDTDVNAAAIGEMKYGITKGLKNSIYMTIGTGVGIGVIVDGKPLHGMSHPEGGHIFLKSYPGDDYAGKCPYHGRCLEGLVAGPAIEEHFGAPAVELADKTKVWEMTAYYIAQALVNYTLILSPQRIVLGGGVMHQRQLFPMIREEFGKQMNGYVVTPEITDIDNFIVPWSLNDNQGILGGLKLARQELEIIKKL